MGGGSGGSSSTQRFEPPSWTTGYQQAGAGPWQDYINKAINVSNQGYSPYPGQTIAGMTPEQISGLNLTYQTAVNSSPDVLAGRGNVQDTASGAYLNNPWTSANSTLGRTAAGEYLQSNPYTSDANVNNVIENNIANMVQANRLGSAAQLDAQAALSGAFGGSAYQQMVAGNQAALGKSIGDMAANYRLGAQQLQAQDYQQARGLQQQAAQAGLGAYLGERGNMMQAAGMAPQLQGMDLQAGAAATGVGDAYRQYQQDQLNQLQSQYNQSLNWDRSQLDLLGNALARASGNAAGGLSTTMTNPYQASPMAALLGLGLAGYGMYGS